MYSGFSLAQIPYKRSPVIRSLRQKRGVPGELNRVAVRSFKKKGQSSTASSSPSSSRSPPIRCSPTRWSRTGMPRASRTAPWENRQAPALSRSSWLLSWRCSCFFPDRPAPEKLCRLPGLVRRLHPRVRALHARGPGARSSSGAPGIASA